MLIYTGRSVLHIEGRVYRAGNVVPLTDAEAAKMAASSNLHSFIEAPGPKPPFPNQAKQPKPDTAD